MQTVSINLRLPADLHAALKQTAADEQRSLNNLIVVALTEKMQQQR